MGARCPVVIDRSGALSHENGGKCIAVVTTLAAERDRRESLGTGRHRWARSIQKNGTESKCISAKTKTVINIVVYKHKTKMKGKWKGNGEFGFCGFRVGFRSSLPSNNPPARPTHNCRRTSASVLPTPPSFRRVFDGFGGTFFHQKPPTAPQATTHKTNSTLF